MAFRNDQQISACCQVLLRRNGLGWAWSLNGPTPRGADAIEKVLAKESPLSSGEKLMLRVALDFWNGDGKATVGDMVAIFDNENLRAIATLLAAASLGPTAIDGWLAENGR